MQQVEQGLRELIAFAKWPVLALRPRSEAISYLGWENKVPFRLDVTASNENPSLATLKDGDILVFAVSELVRRANSGLPLDLPIEFQPTELLHRIGRDAGGRQIKLLAAAISRLHSTTVSITRQQPGKNGYSEFFNLVEDYYRPPSRSLAPWSIRLPSFIANEINLKRFLKIPPEALHLSGLERRFYSWARAHAGGRGFETWKISLRDAHKKAASLDRLPKFSAAVKKIVGKKRLPGFDVAIENSSHGEIIVFMRNSALQLSGDRSANRKPIFQLEGNVSLEDERPAPIFIDLTSLTEAKD